MGYPENPETVVIQNPIYPRGLREIDIWNHYQKYKNKILDETKNRDLMFIIMVEKNKPVVKRRAGSGFIRLTPQNYDQLITGRTVSIHSSMGMYEDFGIIDVDIHPSDGFKWAIKVTSDVYDYIMDKVPLVRQTSIRFTGKTSFHIVCKFAKKMKIDTIRYLLQKFMEDSDLSRIYSVGGKRRAGVPNIDFAPNKHRGSYITLNSLSEIGLMCVEVPYQQLNSFFPRKAKIK
jgi:hypothetical protein